MGPIERLKTQLAEPTKQAVNIAVLALTVALVALLLAATRKG